MIRATDRFTLDTRDAEATAKSVLLANGQALGRVRGSHLDAQFAVDEDGFVLFTSFDDIFSAIQTIYFVDYSGRFLDQVRLGDASEQGLISDIRVDGSDRIRFIFPMNEPHVIRIERKSTLLGLRSRWLHLDQS